MAHLGNFQSFPVSLSAENSCFLNKEICESLGSETAGNRAVALANVQKGLANVQKGLANVQKGLMYRRD